MSKDSEINQIIEEKKQKYLISPSKHLFHGGVIILISFAIGLLYFQFEPISESPEITPEEIDFLRLKFGGFLGMWIALVSIVIYFMWSSWQSYKGYKETKEEIWAAALKKIKKE
jgi:hypothetical protein